MARWLFSTSLLRYCCGLGIYSVNGIAFLGNRLLQVTRDSLFRYELPR